MKKLHFLQLFVLLSLGISFFSCQKEEKEYIDETHDEKTLSATSPLTGLLLRTSQNPGAYDDIIDGNPCASVVLPVTVIANGQEVTVNTPEDINRIHEIFNLFPNDTDTLVIMFPITLELLDYTQVTVASQSELVALAETCNANQAEIGCLDFEYPITFYTYNADRQQTGTVTVNNDWELFDFLQNLDPDDFISIDFPISVILEDGSTVEVTSNQQLQTLIDDCVANTDDDPIDVTEFEEDLTTGVWYVTYFFDDYDETEDFNGYEFSFATDGTAQADYGGTITHGTWALSESFEFELFFGTNPPLDELDEDWEILEATDEIIRLRNVSGGDGSIDFLTFGRTPNTGGNNTELNLFIEDLITGSWYVNLLENDGEDQTANYNGYEFTFLPNGTATAINGTNTVNGFWIAQDDDGVLELVLNFDTSGNSAFDELNDDWDVLQYSQTIIRLSDSSNGGNGTDYLTFGREPNGGGGAPDPQELRNILQDGTWYIDKFLDDGNDETGDFAGYNFDFYSNQTVYASNGTEYVYGIWIVTVTGEELNFEFDMDSPINGADDQNYKALQYTETAVTFITRNSQGDIEDTLVFKKN